MVRCLLDASIEDEETAPSSFFTHFQTVSEATKSELQRTRSLLADSTAEEKRLRAELAACKERLLAMQEKFNNEAQALEQQAHNMHDIAAERDKIAAKLAGALSRASARAREVSALKKELGDAREQTERFHERQVGFAGSVVLESLLSPARSVRLTPMISGDSLCHRS